MYLHIIFIFGVKQGPVILTIVPPSIFPLSGAKVRGKVAPAEKFSELKFD